MSTFSTELLSRLMVLRKNVLPESKLDPWRFSTPQLADMFARHNDAYTLDWVEQIVNNTKTFDTAHNLLHDIESKNLLRDLYCFRILGPKYVKLPRYSQDYFKNFEIASGWWHDRSPRLLPPFEFGVYATEFMGSRIELECWLGNMVASFLLKQYFLDRDGIAVQPSPGDYVIDAGGCFGDTALAFAIAVGENGRVFSFEPIPRLTEVFTANLSRNPHLAGRIGLFDCALSDSSDQCLMFSDYGAGSRPDGRGSIPTRTMSIDDFVRQSKLPKVNFIKMDIEGGERPALRGAADTIRRFRPKLAISAYHLADDLLAIPALIKEIEPSYQLMLDHYTIHQEESVVFAVP
jgi:FkbM family methyltransferase